MMVHLANKEYWWYMYVGVSSFRLRDRYQFGTTDVLRDCRLTVDLNHLMEPLQKLKKGEAKKVAHLYRIVSGFSTHFC